MDEVEDVKDELEAGEEEAEVVKAAEEEVKDRMEAGEEVVKEAEREEAGEEMEAGGR